MKIDLENYTQEGKPKKCKKCGCKKIKEIITDSVEIIITEKEYRCEKCNELLSCWSYGSFESDFYIEEVTNV